MNLHNHADEFHDLITETAEYIGIPDDAVRRDYFIVMLLQQLAVSEYAEQCVFKGGTSLSKCYPETIKRFSEDVDLTLVLPDGTSPNAYNKALHRLEAAITAGFYLEKIPQERNKRNKSAYVWFGGSTPACERIKLEIGSSVRPDPYHKKTLRTYIQEYLEQCGHKALVQRFQLHEVSINTLAIERTFLDKVMAVKRHAVCGNLMEKIRHVYDVTMLFPRDEIQKLLLHTGELKRLLHIIKESDRLYLKKRDDASSYDPCGKYDFSLWRGSFDEAACQKYESLHEDLLYTDEPQNFHNAIVTFERIDRIFAKIGE